MENRNVAILTVLACLLTFFIALSAVFIIFASELVGQIPVDNSINERNAVKC